MRTAKSKRPREWTELSAADVMQTKVVTVARTAPLAEVERLLTKHRISGMPVVDASGKPIGVVSYRDLLDHYAAHPDARPPRDPEFLRDMEADLDEDDFEPWLVPQESSDTAADVMTPVIVDVSTTANLKEICRTMARHGVHRVLVTEPSTGRMVGIVSSLGVLTAIGEQ